MIKDEFSKEFRLFIGPFIFSFVVFIITSGVCLYKAIFEDAPQMYIQRAYVEVWNPELQRTEWVECKILPTRR